MSWNRIWNVSSEGVLTEGENNKKKNWMVCLIAAQGMEYSSSYHVELPALVATILQYS